MVETRVSSASIVPERVPRPKVELAPRNVAIEYGEPGTSDMKLILLGKRGFFVRLSVHKKVLLEHSCFLTDKLYEEEFDLSYLESDDWEDVESFVETVRLVYCKEMKQALMKQSVSHVLHILMVAELLGFNSCTQSCLEYLEVVPWVGEDEEEKVVSSVLRLRGEANDLEAWNSIVKGYTIPTNEMNDWRDGEKKKFQLNAKAMHILFCALGPDEYGKRFSYSNAKEIWDKLQVTHEGTNEEEENDEEKKNKKNEVYINFKSTNESNQNSNEEHESSKKKSPSVCFNCQRTGNVKYDCPLLKKNISSKNKAFVAAWSGEDDSNDEYEVANLCLMAIEEDSKVSSNSNEEEKKDNKKE
ncbi:BTB/POZ domain-containing protein [Hibiscus syriacus]|uniref:BTB/POZ domain-containing protein n=1 Tax=Hibiscus syriacus TaxID=106335 RepID=A0A6A2WJ27_HIBSY|nr:BTB/POZ domain-containing protein [Hibiscus syriacus]